MPPARTRLLLPAVVALGVLAVAGLAAAEVWLAASANPNLPQWDMAKYGASGLGLADAAARLDLGTFVARVWELDVWPPLFPLVEAAAFLVAGDDGFQTPRRLVALLFFAAVLAAGWAAWEVDRVTGAAWGAVAAAMAAALVAASPFLHLFGALTMLEVPGTLLLLASVACAARWLGTGRPGWWTAACATALALFFTKFNYGLLWIVPLLAHEAWRRAGSAAALARGAAAAARTYRWRRPWPIFVAAALLLIATIPLSGGLDFSLFGAEVRATSTGNPLYALFLLAVLRFAVLPGPRGWLLGRLRAAPPVWRTALLVLALPIAVWMLWPEHTKELLGFVENRSSHLPFAEAVLFYPQAFAERFHASPGLGLAVLATVLVVALRLPRLAPGRQVVALAMLVGLAALLLHPYKVERFLSPVAPLVWLASASAFAEAAAQVALRLPLGLGRAVPAVVALGALVLAARAGVDRQRLDADLALHGVTPAAGPVVEAIAATAGAAAGGSVLVGAWNMLSPGLVEWEMRRQSPGAAEPAVPELPERLVGGTNTARILDRAAGRTGRVIVHELAEGAPAWNPSWPPEGGRWDPLRAALAADPRFVPVAEQGFAASGYRLTVYATPTAQR
ncbi:MAG TPA: hypothetical protein VM617_05690 [Thermoanaerobaculia bacterium]|nr:hypothetical protein [Thermoanaerobaculia bacterium]